MKIDDFSNEELIECIKLATAPCKGREGGDLSPIKIEDIHRTDHSVSIKTSQLYCDKFMIERIYKFIDTEDNSIEIKAIDKNPVGCDDPVCEMSNIFRPLLVMIAKNDALKGEDWLSRLKYDDLLYFANKYFKECSKINLECNEDLNDHCKWIHLKDKEDNYIDSCFIGDYGMFYASNDIVLEKENKNCVFDEANIKFYNTIIQKLNDTDKLEYTNQFIAAHKLAFQRANQDKDFFETEMKKADLIAHKIIKSLQFNPVNKTRR